MTAPLQLLLCTDLDRTLLPNGPQPESPGARRRFATLASAPGVVLAFVSGRDRGLVEKAIASYSLPRPDFVISDVGTNIYDLRGGDWQVWEQWQQEIAQDWNGKRAEDLRRMLSRFNGLRLQERKKQNTFKLSYYLPMHLSPAGLEPPIQETLHAQGVSASLVWSVDEPAGIGLLDVVPRRATKLHAVEFLQAALGAGREQTLFAGDSGNDLPVLASAIPAVLVANAIPRVAAEAQAAAAAAGHDDALYLARGGCLGMNGNYSGGVLEGVAHYRPDLVPLFAPELKQGEDA